MKETTRIQFELPEASLDRLKALKDKTEATSYAEVTRNAFKLYERMIELKEAGHTLLVKDRKGNTKELELFF
jgi:hypothetical protein